MADEPTPRIFGTDGIRDLAGRGRLAEGQVTRAGRALVRFVAARGARPLRVLLARDPRPSGPALVARLADAMAAEGAEVVDAGILPSPALAWLVAAEPFALGCSVSASHNPEAYNGIKPFLADGRKLDPAEECAVEALMERVPSEAPACAPRSDPGARGRYVAATVEALRGDGDLAGLRLAGDLSAGAAGLTAPEVLAALGAEVEWAHEAGTRPINHECGTEHPDGWQARMAAGGFDGGLAFDGDADRVLVADETGACLDGDDLLATLATDAHARGGVAAGEVVSTVMANLGLAEYLATLDVALVRTPVGDRNVAARMRASGSTLGGEPAGHIVLPRADAGALVGDGVVAGVRVLQAARRLGRPLSALRALRARRPQTLVNVRMGHRIPLDDWPDFQRAWEREEAVLGSAGRFVIRYSGTEPVLRIMAEGRDADRVRAAVERLAALAAERA
jgi:phosphoglucosamine mutase